MSITGIPSHIASGSPPADPPIQRESPVGPSRRDPSTAAPPIDKHAPPTAPPIHVASPVGPSKGPSPVDVEA
jgi:hypothetical protein